jgi:hypothetical protein
MLLLSLGLIYNEVIDVTTDTEYEFVLPYLSPTPWRRTGYGEGLTSVDHAMGFLSITVINPLTAGDPILQPIEMQVFVRPGSDFQYAYPITSGNKANDKMILDYSGSPPPVQSIRSGVSSSLVEAQSGTVVRKPLGTSQGMLVSNGYSTTTCITSVKQMCSMPTMITQNTFDSPSTVSTQYSPFGTYNDTSYSFLAYLIPCYRYMRGSFRLIAQVYGSEATGTAIKRMNPQSEFFLAQNDVNTPPSLSPTPNEDESLLAPGLAYFPNMANNPMDVTINYDAMVKCQRVLTATSTRDPYELMYVPSVKAVVTAKSGAQVNMYVSFGDDFATGFLMPCPRLRSTR